MNGSTRTCKWIVALATLAVLVLAPLDLHARTVAEKKKAARAQFDIAEHMREELRSQPESARSRRDYDQLSALKPRLGLARDLCRSKELRARQPLHDLHPIVGWWLADDAQFFP